MVANTDSGMNKIQFDSEFFQKVIDFSGKFAIIYKDAQITPLATACVQKECYYDQ